MKLIDGNAIAAEIKREIVAEVLKLRNTYGRPPHLAAILVGEDAASQTYVKNKEKSCKEAGFMSSLYRYPSNISEKDLLEAIHFINNDEEVDGLIVQLPLPAHINVDKIIQTIKPEKDVDGFHPLNFGKMIMNLPTYVPATPLGIMELIKRSNIETDGKNCVVLGRSNIVGTPISILLSRKANPGNATVTMCHSKTKDLKNICATADILVAAIGVPEFVTADMVKEGAAVIDVGIHRIESKETASGHKLIGDVKFDEVSKKCAAITPVPGGVGPMTIAGLLLNTLKAFKKEVHS